MPAALSRFGSENIDAFFEHQGTRPFIDTEDDAFSMFAGEYPARVSRRAVGKPVSRHALMDNKTSLALGPRTFFF